jgi:glutaredoxin 3
MTNVKIYTTSYCPYCQAAKNLLTSKGLSFEEIKLDNDSELRQKISQQNGNYRTVPMIFVDNKFIGGFTDLEKMNKAGMLS